MTTADVLIVVVTHNSAAVIGDLLDSVPAALGHRRAEVIVVDNGSSDATVALAGERADVRVVRASNCGYAAGLNRGVRESTSTAPILVLNPDLRLHAGCVNSLLSTLEARRGAIVAPRVHNSDGSLHHSLRREPSILRTLGLNFTGLPQFAEYYTGSGDYRVAHVVDWALGAALLMSRESFDALGGWDESFFLYSEETDFCLRARDAGWPTVFEPRAVVTHIGGQSGRSGFTHAMQLINRIRLYRRRHGPLAAWLFFALTALREASWVTRRPELTRAALRALFRPSTRPAQLGCSDRLMPR